MVQATERPTFNICEHLDKLTPAKGKNRYICPVCQGNNLTIDPKTGEYQCWNGCECKDIREALRPWGEVKGKSARALTRKAKPPSPAPIPSGAIALATLPNPATHPEKRKRGHQSEIEYPYSDTQWVLRIERPSCENPKGYEKATYPYHLGESGEPTKGKGNAAWNPYRIDEVKAHGAGKWALGVEGESCVEAARYLGLAAFTLQGSAWTEDNLTRLMLQCKSAGVVGVAYFPDYDQTGYKKARDLAAAAAKAQLPFVQLNPLALWPDIPDKGDIADWVKWGMEQGWDKQEFIRRLEEQFNAAADSARQNELERNFNSNKLALKSKFNQRKNLVNELWGNKLRLNTLKQRVELDGEPLDLDFVRSDLCGLLDIDLPREDAVEIVLSLARENQYCPIVEYLERVEAAYPDHGIDFQSLASRLLGTSNPLDAAYLKRHLIGSVARALNPGCKMDTAWILQGRQGARKSTFFQVLYGDEFFDDTMAASSDKDELMKLHQQWAVEWAEFDVTVGRKGYSRLKQFMTTKIDTYRPPYGRTAKSFPRHTVLVGSTNEEEFLNDPSGDRRYWVTRVGLIDIEHTRQLRERIWAAAVLAYRAGEQWWLTPEEERLHDEANKPFRAEDTWEVFIAEYIKDRQFVTIAEVLSKSLEIEPAKQDKSSQMRAAAIIRRLGWHKDKHWHMGCWQRGWASPDRSTDLPGFEVDRKVDWCTNPNEINTSGYTDPPDPPNEQHLSKNDQTKLEARQSEIQESLEIGRAGGAGADVERVESAELASIPATDLPSAPSNLPSAEQLEQLPQLPHQKDTAMAQEQASSASPFPRTEQYAQVCWEGSKFDGAVGKVVRRSNDGVELLVEGCDYTPCFPVLRVRFQE